MHEYGIAFEIEKMAREKAAFRRIIKITIRAGVLSGVVGDSVRMYLELLFRDKGDEPPAIVIEEIKAHLHCSCDAHYEAATMFEPCPACGGFDRTIIDGNQCTIESIEVDDE